MTARKQVTSIPRTFHVDIPAALSDEIAAVPDERVLDVGVEWALGQARELLDRGAPSLHFYVMQSSAGVRRILSGLPLGIAAANS